MNRRNALIGLAAAVAARGMPIAAEAKTKVIVVETAPPAIREAPVPPARTG